MARFPRAHENALKHSKRQARALSPKTFDLAEPMKLHRITPVQPASRISAEQRSRLSSIAVWGVIIALAVIGAFQNGIAAPFLLDDEISILDNESIQKLSPMSSVLWPRNEVYTAGRPLLNF